MMLLNRSFFIITLWAFGTQVFASDWGGHSKLFLNSESSSSHGSSQDGVVLMQRLNVAQSLSEKWQVNAAYEFIANKTNSNATTIDPTQPYRAFHTGKVWSSKDNKSIINQNLDRFQIRFSNEEWRIIAGRQAIWFGVGRISNPTDVFAPISFIQNDKEHRIGVDAVRISHSLGELSDIEFGLVFGDKFKTENSAFFSKIRTNIENWDIEGIFIDFLDATLVGANIQTNWAGIGFFTEMAETKPMGEDPYFRLNFGATAMLQNEVILNGEFHYNGAGERDYEEYFSSLDSFSFTNGGVWYLAKEYASLGFSVAPHPLWQISSDVILNINDQSFLVRGGLEHSIADELSAGIYAVIPNARKTGTEFTEYPRSVQANMRFYF